MKSCSIFIIGSERSGSNLLRTLLGNHYQVSAPIAPHLYDSFKKSLFYYGDLKVRENMIQLLDDMISLSNHEYINWNFETTPMELFDEYHPDTFYGAFNSLYTANALKEGKQHYVCKGNHMFEVIFEIIASAENPKFLYLHRDPRDHVASWLKTPLYMYTPLQIISKWEREQQKCISLIEGHNVEMLKISYEELISQTESEVKRILSFLSLPTDQNCFVTNKKNSESTRNIFWKNLAKPIDKTNTRNYRSTLTAEDICIVEYVAARSMSYLKYQRDTQISDVNLKQPFFRVRNKWRHFRNKKRATELKNTKMKLLLDKNNLVKKLRNNIKQSARV